MVFNGPKLLVDAAKSASPALDCKVKWLDEKALEAQLQRVAAASDESSTALLVYLGKDVEMSMSYWALDIASSPLLQSLYNEHEQMFSDPRPTVFSLSSFEAGVFALASSVLDFNRRIKFCSGCGSKTMMGDSGWKRICSNQECVSHKRTENYSYIRTDAVVIVNVESSDGESILLGRQKSWPPKRYSCIAGFLEPGESLAQAAVREVLEETGVRLDTQSIMFSSSQPWPFPSQLMLGMQARAAEGKGSVIDISSRDLELEDAKWFTRLEVLEALGLADDGTEKRSGELKLPPDYAIAHSLIKSWAVDTPSSAFNKNPKLYLLFTKKERATMPVPRSLHDHSKGLNKIFEILLKKTNQYSSSATATKTLAERTNAAPTASLKALAEREINNSSSSIVTGNPSLERQFENKFEKSFLSSLFPTNGPQSFKLVQIINAKKDHSAAMASSVASLSSVKLDRVFAQIYAALEAGPQSIETAESLFHKSIRSNRTRVMEKMISISMVNRFIQVLLERQVQERRQGQSSAFNDSWEARAWEWLDNIPRYGLKANLHSYCLFLDYYLDQAVSRVDKAKQVLEKIKENWSVICEDLAEEEGESVFDSAFVSGSSALDSLSSEKTIPTLGDSIAADECFSGDKANLEKLNEVLVSAGHKPLSRFAEKSISELLLSALGEEPLPTECDPTSTSSKSNDGEEDLRKLNLEATETIGVNILLSILKSKESIAGMDKYNQQLWLESRALTAAQDQFEQEQKKMPKDLRKLSHLPQNLISSWHQALQQELLNTIQKPSKKEDESIIPFLKLVSPDIVCRIVIASILRLPHRKNHDESPEKALTRFGQFSLIELAQLIGNSIQREHNLQQLHLKKNQKKLNMQKSIQRIHANGKLFNMAVRRAVLELKRREDAKIESWNPEWGLEVITIVGSYLLDKAIQVCLIPVQTPTDIKDEYTQNLVPALQHTLEWKNGKKYGVIKLHPSLYDLISTSSVFVAPWSLPMLVKPLPWLHSRAGGYLQHRFSVVRTAFNKEHDEYIKAADESEHLSTMLRSLDVLGSTGWKVNSSIFRVAAHFWNSKESAPGIGALLTLPEVPVPSEMVEAKKNGATVDIKIKKAYEKECQKRQTLISNAFSERCSTNYKLEIARAFLGETIYFPHNVDFRGRAYPIPPNLNHMGDDLCRGLLQFDEKRPLGSRGLWWLKVHISNLYGFDKAPLRERCAFTEHHLAQVLDSAQNPINGDRWWLKAEKPWQLLAACIELAEALKTPDPTSYLSSVPIHQDGSCNGLQHYAALGGDELGAAAVNLTPADRPDDIYTKISKQVQLLVDEEAAKQVPEALLMQKRVNRKLVKQSVMTNTYGVTFIGARDQIRNRLKEARESEAPETALTDEQMKKCAGYSAKLVFRSMDRMFEGARGLQIWLTNAASLVTKSVAKEAVDPIEIAFYEELEKEGLVGSAFIDPDSESGATLASDDDLDILMEAASHDTQVSKLNGFSCSNPSSAPNSEEEEIEFDDIFENRSPVTIKRKKPARMTSMIWTSPLGMPIVQPYRKDTTAQIKTHLQSLTIAAKAGPVNSTKQASAFPPNFVHSLDASHMMLSSIACESQKMVFAAVHDSYWTHACDVDKMSQILRECFIRLHSQDIMGRLREELVARFSDNRLARSVPIKPEDLKKIQDIAARVGLKSRFNKRSKSMTLWVPFSLDPLPKKGSFDINQVAKSTYFFH